MPFENPNFLKKKYDLHKSPEVESAADRTEARDGAALSQDPNLRIQNYLDRFKEITERTDPDKRERGMNALKTVLHDKFVIKAEDVPPSYYNLQGEIAIREGRQKELEQGGVAIQTEKKLNARGEETEERQFIFPPDLKEQAVAVVRNNQTQSLDKWIDYLAADDAQYPDWAKYWAFRSLLEMGKLQKTEDDQGRTQARFAKRVGAKRHPATGELANDPTVASFPPLNPRALALTIGALREKLREQTKPKKERQPVENKSVKLNQEEFQQLLSTENFSRIYAQFLLEMPEYSTERLEEVRGRWQTYPQGSNANQLVTSLEGYPLEWCIADVNTAQTYLQGGDLHLYYSSNEDGEAIIPRLAIRMEGDRIAEPPRGIAPDQNLDPYIAPVLEKKLKEFGQEGQAFEKRAADMKRLTEIGEKSKHSQPLTKEDLTFLYEIDQTIDGFGLQRDPRIGELREPRNPLEDMPTVFDCTKEQIAQTPQEINQNTKAYVGQLEPGIFTKIRQYNIEHVYTVFPEGKIRRGSGEIGIRPKENMETELKQKNNSTTRWSRDMLKSREFTVADQPEQIDLVCLTVADLGFPSGATTEEIYRRADELGLELCPAEVGPQLRLKEDTEQQFGKYFHVAMKQIPGSRGRPGVFCLGRNARGPWLGADDARPSNRWHPDRRFVFRLRPSTLRSFD